MKRATLEVTFKVKSSQVVPDELEALSEAKIKENIMDDLKDYLELDAEDTLEIVEFSFKEEPIDA